MFYFNSLFKVSLLATAVALAGCGGGSSAGSNGGSGTGGGTGGSGNGGNTVVTYTAGVYPAEAQLKNFCAVPRSGTDPYTNQAYPDKAGSAQYEKMWLRSWSNRTYLWYSELPDLNPAGYSVEDYFDLLKTAQTTDSGAAKDQYHYAENTAEYQQTVTDGVVAGYGIKWQLRSATPPRQLMVTYVEPQSPAATAGVRRGDSLKFIDGIDFVNANSEAEVDTLNAVLFSSSVGEPHQFVFERIGGASQTFNLVAADVSTSPVQNVQVLDNGGSKVGYLQFNSHIAHAQPQLIAAVEQFAEQNVSELIVDLRYNGGGLLALASQFGYMVAGDNIIQDRIFEKTQFNDKYPTTDPVTGQPLTPMPFYSKVIDYAQGRLTTTNLPSLGLSRVFVLTSENTCSASEAFINGLRGIDVEVIQIGGQTCGKPYGFYPTDNCGTTYSSIQFSGINAKGFGDYADGFTPKAAPVFAADVKGCPAADDLTKPLGDANEGMLKTALYYAANNSCPVTVASAAVAQQPQPGTGGLAIKQPDIKKRSFILENKINQPIR
ncbi:S41 family peptidase [Rheinheimera muenzenbergensis]|uniref:S41 family peptidase n=1 Tax=Rheinheimera muenzenbergensis TaxID=1193628 RepID=A0ABU8C9G6_9GAMM